MKIFSYNVRGLGSKVKKREVREIIQNQNIDFCMIQETKMESFGDYDNKIIWGSDNVGGVSRKAEGRSGGILTLWNPINFSCSSSWDIPGALFVNGRWNPGKIDICLINVYAPQSLADRWFCGIKLQMKELGEELSFRQEIFRASTLSSEERTLKTSVFKVENTLGTNLKGCWQEVSKERYRTTVRSLLTQKRLIGGQKLSGWSSFVFKEKMKRLKTDLKSWNRVSFGSLEENISRLKSVLQEWDIADETSGLNEEEILQRNETTTKLNILMKNRDDLLAQKAKIRWLKDGDINNSFYHKAINGRRAKNHIAGLHVKDRWLEDPGEVKKEIRSHFENQFKIRSGCKPTLPDDFVQKGITEEMRSKLDASFTEEEVKMAVWSCDGGKSPGPDGFNFHFIKKCWNILKEDIMKVMGEFHSHGSLARGCNPSFLVLIPKKDSASCLKDYRPISLINCMYKVLAKVLAGRLKQVMNFIISDSQSAFIEGRFILDGVIVLNEIIDESKKRKKGTLLFKVDFAKAYDTVDWSFLDIMMGKMRFSQRWRNWISGCLRSSTANVLINGSPSGEFQLERGLRQGDPLSPFLYLIVAEGLSLLTERAVKEKLLEPVEIGVEKIKVSHLQYADDTMFVASGKVSHAWAFKSILTLLEKLSGLSVNFEKSSLFGIGIPSPICLQLASVIGCKLDSLPTKYLGIRIGSRLNRASEWSFVEEKIKQKIIKWNNRKLSMAGRSTLIRSILTSIPIYHLSFSIFPKKVLRNLQSLLKGGLGFIDLERFNKALMLKWLWRFLNERDSLWVRVMRASKGDILWDEEGFRLEKSRVREAGWWKRVLGLSQGEKGSWFRDNLDIKIGEGNLFKFWHHAWQGEIRLRDRFSRLFRINSNKGGYIRDMGEWDQGKNDRWIWKPSPNGFFSVNSAYKEISKELSSNTQSSIGKEFRSIWKAAATQKAKFTAWRILKDRMATCENLIRRQISISNVEADCIFCRSQQEDSNHLFFGCQRTSEIWYELLSWLGVQMALQPRAKEHFNTFSNLGNKKDACTLRSLWIRSVWCIWNLRNECKFSKSSWSKDNLIREIKSRTWTWSSAFGSKPAARDFKAWMISFR
ncbi:uncharacterized protein LOC131018471 [Salvia miltiorrhiza]|uniref:uncharacterized protein LOC131018471 n=1 Tax=Salvia miltiorrhiza TaxID=226208 RepID=UPI0025AC42C9|nr:uncharacterized protein LOC131018471 [Salvia miltiorrhiza]